ncbi:AAA family ATPase [Schleiferilactobacillus shenzhenensis]|nr:AAA family ATPase [Schleiferilactobacillus shenzhenensis]
MQYLTQFFFPDEDVEWHFFISIKKRTYTSYYPFQVLPDKGLTQLDLAPITILNGGNGSGKTTVLNIMAEKLGLQREAPFNRSNFFKDYLDRTDATTVGTVPKKSAIITSDDVFDYMLTIRQANTGLDNQRTKLEDAYLTTKHARFQFSGPEDYDQLKRILETRSKTQSRYIRDHMMRNLPEGSNGESAMAYFTDRIKENALYLLDEPENSLSPEKQQELVKFIGDSARFFGCQFIIATHSPFLLALPEAKVYDMDTTPVAVRKWTELPEVRAYYDFFAAHRGDFES